MAALQRRAASKSRLGLKPALLPPIKRKNRIGVCSPMRFARCRAGIRRRAGWNSSTRFAFHPWRGPRPNKSFPRKPVQAPQPLIPGEIVSPLRAGAPQKLKKRPSVATCSRRIGAYDYRTSAPASTLFSQPVTAVACCSRGQVERASSIRLQCSTRRSIRLAAAYI